MTKKFFKSDTSETNTRNFLSWFVGFSEGDGSWIVSSCYDKRIHKFYLRTFFIINQADPKVLFFIKKNLGFGTVKKLASGYWRYCVTSKDGTEKLINIFKNNLKLEKTNERFKLFVKGHNSRVLVKEYFDNETFLSNSEVSLNDGWLSGFIDAEGCFSSSLRKNSISLKFSIRQVDTSSVVDNIKNILEGGSISRGKNNLNSYYWSSTNPIKCLLIDYLDEYNLHSKKIIDYERWKKIRIRLIDGSLKKRLEGRRSRNRLFRLLDVRKTWSKNSRIRLLIRNKKTI